MPVLDNAGGVIVDRFATIADDAVKPAEGPIILSLTRLLAEPSVCDGSRDVGVLLPGGATLDPVAPLLARLALVGVDFPLFRDGRAFTLARELRERFHYKGDVRATGHLLADQYVFLIRCGVSSVALPDDADVAVWSASLHRQSHPEQPPMARALPLLRRIAMPFQEA